ncbi:MAG TPA: hypothetical protein VI522_08415, partial [Gammaproteobacteria bacterium]|nr:hypothetical protein [Gammaproteobacteria bacterium]
IDSQSQGIPNITLGANVSISGVTMPDPLTVGEARIGTDGAGTAEFSQKGNFGSATNFGYRQEADGDVFINAPAGKNIDLQINGVTILRINTASGIFTQPGNAIVAASAEGIVGAGLANFPIRNPKLVYPDLGIEQLVANSDLLGILQLTNDGTPVSGLDFRHLLLGHLLGGTEAPAVVAGAGAGVGATIDSVTGNDLGFAVTFTTGVLPAAGVIFTATFNIAYTVNAPKYIPGARNLVAAAAMNNIFVSNETLTTVELSGVAALVGATQYVFNLIGVGDI